MIVPSKYSVEDFARVYDDKNGDYIQVGPDSDGVDLVEIKHVDGKETRASLILFPEQAVLLAKAILKLYDKKDVEE